MTTSSYLILSGLVVQSGMLRVSTYNNLVPALEVCDLASKLMNHTSKLMARDEARGDVLLAAVPVQIASTEGRDGHFDNGVAGVLDGGNWAVFDLDLPNTFKDDSSH